MKIDSFLITLQAKFDNKIRNNGDLKRINADKDIENGKLTANLNEQI